MSERGRAATKNASSSGADANVTRRKRARARGIVGQWDSPVVLPKPAAAQQPLSMQDRSSQGATAAVGRMIDVVNSKPTTDVSAAGPAETSTAAVEDSSKLLLNTASQSPASVSQKVHDVTDTAADALTRSEVATNVPNSPKPSSSYMMGWKRVKHGVKALANSRDFDGEVALRHVRRLSDIASEPTDAATRHGWLPSTASASASSVSVPSLITEQTMTDRNGQQWTVRRRDGATKLKIGSVHMRRSADGDTESQILSSNNTQFESSDKEVFTVNNQQSSELDSSDSMDSSGKNQNRPLARKGRRLRRSTLAQLHDEMLDSDDDKAGESQSGVVPLAMYPFINASKAACDQAALTARSYFGSRNFGTVVFDNLKSPWYFRITKEKDSRFMAQNMIDFMIKQLRYPPPRLVISVTGGALDFELSRDLEVLLKRGLRNAAEATNAWIVTGGTHCGIMKYVGQAMSEIDDGRTEDLDDGGDDDDQNLSNRGAIVPKNRIPVIGIATWGILEGLEEFAKGGVREFSHQGQHKDITLDPNHGIFFLYDDGTRNQFGREIDLRKRFEASLRKTMFANTGLEGTLFKGDSSVFSVCLVVEGGPVTMDVVAESIISHIPVVVIEGSGRAADVIAYAWRFLHDSTPAGRHLSRAGLRMCIRKLLPAIKDHEDPLEFQMKLQAQVKQHQDKVLELVLIKDQVTVFSMSEEMTGSSDASTGLAPKTVDGALLDAILRSLKVKSVSKLDAGPDRLKLLKSMDDRAAGFYEMHQSKLFLSLVFNRVDVARIHMRSLRVIARERKVMDRLGEDLEVALMWSLFNQRDGFVKLIAPLIDIQKFLYSTMDGRSLGPADSSHASSLKNLPSRSEPPPNMCRMQVLYDFVQDAKIKKYLHALIEDKIPRKVRKDLEGKLKVRLKKSTSGDTTLRYTNVYMDHSGDSKVFCKINTLIGMSLNKSFKPSWEEESSKTTSRIISGSNNNKSNKNIIIRNAATIKFERDKGFQALLIWACLMLRFDLAEYFWEEGGSSIPTGLYASTLLNTLARSNGLNRHGHFKAVTKQFAAAALRFEKLAVGVLTECYAEHGDRAQILLRQKLFPFSLLRTASGKYCDALDLAARGRQLNFLSHPACLAQIESEWRGLIHSEASGTLVWITAFCPVYLLFSTDIFIDNIYEDIEPDLDTPVMTTNPGRFSIPERYYAFYDAPLIKYYLDVVSLYSLAVLYSTVTLSDLSKPMSESASEMVLMVWITVLTFEELQQVSEGGLINWLYTHWNACDAVVYVMYYIALIVRLQAVENDRMVMNSKLLYGVGNMALFMRLMRLFYNNAAIGPKLLMLTHMFSDVVTFVALLFVVLVAYGVATTAILFPYAPPDQQTLAQILFRPYFQIFGELYLEEVHELSQCIGPAPFQSCGNSSHELLPVLSGLYLLVTNIVLVNLLIAMICETYDKVQKTSELVWRMQEYDMLQEYKAKSRLPNPFSLLGVGSEYVVQFWGWIRCRGEPTVEGTDADHNEAMKIKVLKQQYREVESFQEKNTDKFRDRSQLEYDAREDVTLTRLEQCVADMRKMMLEMHTEGQRADYRAFDGRLELMKIQAYIQQIKERLRIDDFEDAEKRIAEVSANLAQIRKRCEDMQDMAPEYILRETSSNPLLPTEQAVYGEVRLPFSPHVLTTKSLANTVCRTSSSYVPSPDRICGPFVPLEWNIIDRGPEKQRVCFAVRSQTGPDEPLDNSIMTAFEGEIDPGNHISAQPILETGSPCCRCEVPAEKVPWSVPWPEYAPPEYTAPYVLAHGPDSSLKRWKWAHHEDFTQIIASALLERSVFGDIVVGNIPRNPIGRTGLCGRGLLGMWGANITIDNVVTRWKVNDDGVQIERKGRPVLEVVLCKRADNVWALPGSFALADGINPILRKAFGLKGNAVKIHEDLREVERVLQRSKVLFHGYMDDDRNTDNAWIETSVRHVHDDTGVLQKFELTSNKLLSDVKEVSWAVVHKNLKLHAEHDSLLMMICQQMNAFW